VKTHRVIIAGGREFNDWQLLKTYVSYYLLMLEPSEVEIVSGCCGGADQLGEEYSILYGYPLIEFEADWKKYGKAAGPIRNKQMAEYGTHLIAFWNGRSPGTMDMIKQAKEHGLLVRVVKY
jgi:hypothetical protein